MQEIKDNYIQDECTQNVMRRVRHVYLWKNFGKPFVIECALLGSVLSTTVFLVSVDNIYRNISERGSITEVYQFIVSAFQHTELSTKTLSLAALVLVALIARDIMLACSRVVHRIKFRSAT